jgi:polyisoprenoid-binding protein YceI
VKRFNQFLMLIIFLTQSSHSWALVKFKTVPSTGHFEFLAIGRPAMIRIKGEAPGPKGSVEISDKKVTGSFKFNLNDLSTGISMRDRHMKEKYLETGKNPEAVLTLRDVIFKDTIKSENEIFQGDLSLHGVTKKVSGVASFETVEGRKKAHVEFSIHIAEFGIALPSYAGIEVADEVQMKMDLNLTPD